MTEAEVDPQYRKLLLGQHIGLDESYLKPTEQQLLQKYVKVIDSITFNEENRLRIKVEELTEKQSEIEVMKLEQRQKDVQLEQMHKQMLEFQEQYKHEREEAKKEFQMITELSREIADLKLRTMEVNRDLTTAAETVPKSLEQLKKREFEIGKKILSHADDIIQYAKQKQQQKQSAQ